MKLTITQTKETTTEKEIELPYFTKGICYAHKIIDEKTAIQVCYSESGIVNESVSFCSPNSAAKDKQCTENEFNEIYHAVMDRIEMSFVNSLKTENATS